MAPFIADWCCAAYFGIGWAAGIAFSRSFAIDTTRGSSGSADSSGCFGSSASCTFAIAAGIGMQPSYVDFSHCRLLLPLH
jgi:hypothetical protein